jgi:hypothetical protein
MAKKQALTKREEAALAVPDYVNADSTAGKENITQADITLPRLGLAQALSPEVNEGEANFIPGCMPGHLFNTLTRETYAKGPVPVVVVSVAPPRWVEFNPREEGGGIKDPNVPAGDPRTLWDGDTPPVATQFRDYLCLHAETGEPLGVSLKGTSLKAAKDLNSFIKLFPGPSYAKVYNVTTVQRKNEKGTFYVFKFQPAEGFAPEHVYRAAENIAQTWADSTVIIEEQSKEKDDMPGEETPF